MPAPKTIPKPGTNPIRTRNAVMQTVGVPLRPDAEGFLQLECPNCTEPIRFRPAYSELYRKGDKQPAAPVQPEPPSNLPEWMKQTPELSWSGYYLLTLDAGDWEQDVELTLDEYNFLKRTLATSRGFEVPEEEEANAAAE